MANGGGEASGCGAPGVALRIVFLDDQGNEVSSYTRASDNIQLTWDNTDLIYVGPGLAPEPSRVYLPLIAR